MSQDSRPGEDLPPGAVLGDRDTDAIVDRAGDLDYTTDRLRLREQQLLAEYERNAKALEKLGAGGKDVTGRGWAAHEAVVIVVDAANKIVDLEIDPKALRLGSIDNLRKAILTAYENATEDVAEQLREHTLDAVPQDALRAMLDSMPEVTALMPDGAYTRFLEDRPQSDGRATPPRRNENGRAGNRADWEEKNPYE